MPLIHVDADAFFASCEQAINPAYRGKPVVTGLERKIVSAASYEAKKLGIKRGVPLWDVKKICPEAIILPSHYETYSLFSKRMFDILRRYTSQVEEYSIDEAFADITGLRRPLHKSYAQIAISVKNAIEKELGITVSVGLASTKVLTKIASKWKKPSGFTEISYYNRPDFLKKTSLEDLWGIGRQTAAYLNKFRVYNAWQYAQASEDFIDKKLSKPYKEIWRELNEERVYQVSTQEKDEYKSIGKTKTFSPPSSEAQYVFAQLSKNVENAFIKARRHNLAAKKMMIFLKTNDFRYRTMEVRFNRATCFPNEAMGPAKQAFLKLFSSSFVYRATGVVIFSLQSRFSLQMNLFEKPLTIEKIGRVYEAVDDLSQKYGKHIVFLGSSLPVMEKQKKERQFIGLPCLGQAT
ncbi:MAG: DNA polymerase IV [Patescibacteria group bacterium]|jgi:DNA polymerase-4/DNA polymerase V